MFGLVVILHSLPVVATGVPTYIAHECALAGPGEIITWRENNLETTSSKLLFCKQIIPAVHVMGFKYNQNCSDCGSDVCVLSKRFGFCSAWYISRKCTLVFPCGTPRCVQKYWSSLWTASHRTCTPIDHPDFSASLT